MNRHTGRRTDQVSGGEAQRVALARALARPELSLLIADEPTASLDAGNARMVSELLVDRVRSRGITALVATHDLSVAAACDRTIALSEANLAGLAG